MAKSRSRTSTARYRTAAALLAAAVVVAALGALDAGSAAVFLAKLHRFPRADSPQASSADTARLHFRFRGRTRFVTIPVDAAELRAARDLDTSCVFSTVGPVRQANLTALVRSQARSRTVDGLSAELRRLRHRLSLDDDEYLEMVTRFVQSIPYGTIDSEVRLPVEVVTEGKGVCDDKSVLMAALLLHEGYDTAIWAFDSQAHAAVGVRCAGEGTFGSGYAMIETTRIAYVGDVRGSLGTRAAWRRNPDLTRLGGTLVYRADRESELLVDTLQRAHSTARTMKPYVRALASGPTRWRPVYAEAVDRHRDALQLAMRIEMSIDDRHRIYEQLSGAAAF